MELPSRNGDNSKIELIRKMRLLLDNDEPLDRIRESRQLFSFFDHIFRSGATGKVFMHLLSRGATTAWLLQVDLEIPEATVYQALKRLRTMELITPEYRIPKGKHSRGGPRSVVWALLTATPEEVAWAARDHRRVHSPSKKGIKTWR